MIGGKRWDLSFTRLTANRGDCEGPHVPNKRIRVDSSLDGEEKLEVILHECLHAADWKASEEYIEQTAIDLASILWRLGYRQTGNS